MVVANQRSGAKLPEHYRGVSWLILKVIQVLHHSIGAVDQNADPQSGQAGWHELVAREIAKRTSEVDIECWRPESSLSSSQTWTDEYGVVHRVYPSFRIRYGMELSLPLMEGLRSKLRHDHNFLLHLHGLYNLHTYALVLLMMGKVPIIAQSHEIIDARGGILQRLRNVMRRCALHPIDRFLVSTESEARKLPDVDSNKIELAPMPVDLRLFREMNRHHARTTLGWDPKGHYVLYVGRLEERKGIPSLLQAARILTPRIPDFHLIMVGAGRLDCSSSISAVVNQVNYSDLPTYYNAADLLVLPSQSESWGRVVLESLACQTPVVATRTGCVPILLKKGMQGLFTIPKNDVPALVDGISDALSQSAGLRAKINRDLLDEYSSEHFVRRMIIIYNELA